MMTKRGLAILGTLVLLLPVATTAVGFSNPLDLFRRHEEPATSVAQSSPVAAPAELPSFRDVARQVRPAVVNLATTHTVRATAPPPFGPFGENDPFSEFFRHFFAPQGYPGKKGSAPQEHTLTQSSLGSGVVVDSKGHIVTNAHVVKDSDTITVTLHDGRTLQARVVGVDEKTDLALLEAKDAHDLVAATLGDSDGLEVGDWVIAIGNPFGLAETVTAGIVSAKGRVIGAGPYDDFIQTDASINPGNSGGPLLDTQGNVVGINSAIFSQTGGNIGIGFAIPINLVKDVLEQLGDRGKVVRGWLGVVIQDVTAELAPSFGLKKPEGALVSSVTPGGPAARAGLETGDVIVAYNDVQIDRSHALPALVAKTPVGGTATVDVLRNGEKKTLSITVGEMPGESVQGDAQAGGGWGLAVEDIAPDVARHLDRDSTKGALVSAVTPGSPAAVAGLRPGDVIVQVDRVPVDDAAACAAAMKRAAAGHVLLLVERDGRNAFVALQQKG